MDREVLYQDVNTFDGMALAIYASGNTKKYDVVVRGIAKQRGVEESSLRDQTIAHFNKLRTYSVQIYKLKRLAAVFSSETDMTTAQRDALEAVVGPIQSEFDHYCLVELAFSKRESDSVLEALLRFEAKQ